MRNEYKRCHERIREVLAEPDEWLRPIESATGMHLTALLPEGRYLAHQAVLRRTDGSGVAVNSLPAFYADKPAQSGLVLGYGAIPLARIENGLRLLRHLLSRPSRRQEHQRQQLCPHPRPQERHQGRLAELAEQRNLRPALQGR